MDGTKVKKILTVAGSDSGGGAGIQADLKTIAALGGYGMSVITAVTAQNTLGVQGIHPVPPEFVAMQFDSVARDIGVDAVKTGMLAGPKTVKTVAEKIRSYRIEKVVVDPVMAAKGGAGLIGGAEAIEVLIRELLPLAWVITPNIPEAEVISGMKIESIQDMKEAAKAICQLGAAHVVIKGGHAPGDPVDVLLAEGRFYEFRGKRQQTKDTHGTGCTFASAIAVGLADGLSVHDAAEQAHRFIGSAIRSALRIGQGHGPINITAAFCEKNTGDL